MKCQRCGREINEADSFSYQGRTLCEDCYMEAGLHPRECDPWETYSATHTPGGAGPKSQLVLTDQQNSILELVRSRGKLARTDLMTELKLSEADIDAVATTLLRAELAKIISEGGKFYLIPIAPPNQ